MKTALVLTLLLMVVPARTQQTQQPPTQQPDAPAKTPQQIKAEKKLVDKQAKANAKDSAKLAKQEPKWAKKEQKFQNRLASIRIMFPKLDEQHVGMIANHQLFIGMTTDMLRESWDFQPDKVNWSRNESGLHEQWVYDWTIIGNGRMYVYLDNGVVTSYQREQ